MNPSEALEAVKHMIVPTIQQMNDSYERCSANKVSATLGLGALAHDRLRSYMAKMAEAGILKREGSKSGSSWIVVGPNIPLPAVKPMRTYKPRTYPSRRSGGVGHESRDVGPPVYARQYHAAAANATEAQIAVAFRGRKFEDDPRAVRRNAPEYSHLRRRNEQN